jgi:UDP-glucose 4-epimerase
VHLASRKAVDDDDPRGQFRDNTEMTYDIVEAALDAGVSEFVFTSSSTVYGEAPRPTPEDYAPLEPISAYGASKLACEGILSTAAHSHGLSVYNFRFANIVGPRLRGAVVPDFIEKLRESPDSLRILGDGRQEKSYMHVEDCLDAMLYVYEHADGPMATFNLGTRTTTSVNRIANIVADEMELTPDYQYTGGDRGWTGDVPKMRLSVEKLSGVGWEPSTESDRAVRRATRELLDEL